MVFLHSRLQHKHTDLAADANDMIVPAEYVISANAHSGTNDHDMIAQTSHPGNVNGPHYSQLKQIHSCQCIGGTMAKKGYVLLLLLLCLLLRSRVY